MSYKKNNSSNIGRSRVRITPVNPKLKQKSRHSKTTTVYINSITPLTTNVNGEDLSSIISDVEHNELTTDDNNKLLSHKNDTDYLAYYLISRG